MSNSPVADYDAITQAVSAYIEGGRAGSGATTKRAFHGQANIFGYLGGNLLGPDMQKLYDARDKSAQRRTWKPASPAWMSQAPPPMSGWTPAARASRSIPII